MSPTDTRSPDFTLNTLLFQPQFVILSRASKAIIGIRASHKCLCNSAFSTDENRRMVRILYSNLHRISVHPIYLPQAKLGFLLDTISCMRDHRQQSTWVPCTRYLYRHLVTQDASSSVVLFIHSLSLSFGAFLRPWSLPSFIHHALSLLPSFVHTRLFSIVLSFSRGDHALSCFPHPSP